jgi:hypothetical protein
MLVALCVLAGALLAAGFYLIMIETARFRADRQPAPPLAPEAAARDFWTALVTDLIAGLLIVGALITWQANATFGAASDLTSQAQRETARYQAASAQTQSLIEFGDRLTALLQQHTVAADQLRTQADQARTNGDSALANQLDASARVESVEARAFQFGFFVFAPTAGAGGAESFDRRAMEQLGLETSTDLRTLDQRHAQTLAATAAVTRSTAQKLVLAAGSIAASVFFWTITRLGWRHRRLTAAVPAFAAVAVGFAFLLLATFS